MESAGESLHRRQCNDFHYQQHQRVQTTVLPVARASVGIIIAEKAYDADRADIAGNGCSADWLFGLSVLAANKIASDSRAAMEWAWL